MLKEYLSSIIVHKSYFVTQPVKNPVYKRDAF